MRRSVLFWLIVALLVISALFSQGNVMTDQCVNGACLILAKTSPVAVLVAIVMLVLVLSYGRKHPTPLEGQVSLRTRIAAFLIDLFAAASIMGPLTALPMLGYAALVSGPFVWAVQSTSPGPVDHLVALALVASGFAGALVYFLLPVAWRLQTPGQYIMGYRVVTDGARSPNWLVLGIFAFVGVVTWPISLLLASRRTDREFWWSAQVGLHAVGVG